MGNGVTTCVNCGKFLEEYENGFCEHCKEAIVDNT